MTDTHYTNEDRDSTPRLTPQPEERTPTTREPYSNRWEDNNREPEIIMEHVPLLNGGPPTSQNEPETIPGNVVVSTTTSMTTTGTITIESASIPSTPQVSSTGIGERAFNSRPIYLPEEDPQIPCPVCEVVDCMIHNLRHRYFMNCAQRLLGPHACPNERECPELPIVQYPIPIGITRSTEAEWRVESSERRAHFPEDPLLLPEDTDVESFIEMVLSSACMLNMDLVTRPVPPIPPPAVLPRPSLAELLMYDEAITSDQGIAA